MPTLTQITAGSFCRELVAGLEPLPDLLKSWNMTDKEYQSLRRNEWFQKELKAAVSDVRDMGPDSTFIMRCKVLSETFLEDIVGMMQNTTTPPDVKARLFDTVTDLARLTPQKNNSSIPSGNQGPQVVFNFGAGLEGVPKSLSVTGNLPPIIEGEKINNHG